jgi:hypothetical protein
LYRVQFGVPFQVRTNARGFFSIGYAGCGFEGPTVVNSGAVEGSRYYWIEVELVGADGAF